MDREIHALLGKKGAVELDLYFTKDHSEEFKYLLAAIQEKNELHRSKKAFLAGDYGHWGAGGRGMLEAYEVPEDRLKLIEKRIIKSLEKGHIFAKVLVSKSGLAESVFLSREKFEQEVY